jgi:WhiB family redox-sensing transcriptional regulator
MSAPAGAPALRSGTSWRNRSACVAADPNLFFPPRGTATVATTEQARAICARCPVRLACLTFALDYAIDFGIWGGCTREERRELRRGQAETQRRERDAAIAAAAANGSTRKQIAKEFGLKVTRVSEILSAQRGAM